MRIQWWLVLLLNRFGCLIRHRMLHLNRQSCIPWSIQTARSMVHPSIAHTSYQRPWSMPLYSHQVCTVVASTACRVPWLSCSRDRHCRQNHRFPPIQLWLVAGLGSRRTTACGCSPSHRSACTSRVRMLDFCLCNSGSSSSRIDPRRSPECRIPRCTGGRR